MLKISYKNGLKLKTYLWWKFFLVNIYMIALNTELFLDLQRFISFFHHTFQKSYVSFISFLL